ncbi:phosphonate metabolism protein/1,5-bisphosphokinase (PRPP-forming) PhnN [Pelovirga terrestris]|uniref:Ribose 1,5-bisphosphate phosphokinase PhnN n=1 Tax=Pelovirga terrestris TaxID=2771352 RepID=A0A8J6QUW7_9BACT|nr:phosphonate metabolism protein/1,5-bisphosphokinase (PRPP-forming) PhnN [Pelovirga terrestris]MBD1400865.1 phosphonate metabolism protein/1,5-bisphosphokinase (PRPP-forming) PhnN [Pelovirga terrestris]
MEGQLLYLMGASGSGKDSLMGYAREKLTGHSAILFAHRYITRSADAGAENHVALSPAEFHARVAAGLFALHWHSHNHDYGIGREIDLWLAGGATVVVNGSRAYLPRAQKRYPNLIPLCIEVSPEVLRTRLHERGRETAQQIAGRLQRHQRLAASARDCLAINNNGLLAEGGNTLIGIILHYAGQRSRRTKNQAAICT